MNKEVEEQEKVEKGVHSFNIEKELEKVNIPVPLLKLAKKPTYKKKISNFINLTHVTTTQDIVNLQ